MIPEEFGKTEMGRDLLAQDYLLKQLTASLIYPEDELGRNFWTRVYQRARDIYGTNDIPVNTFNKVWIVPERAVIHEQDRTVMIVETRLKVMLETDYFALQVNGERRGGVTPPLQSGIESQILREIIIPEIEREVNEGAHFAPLRQVYHSMVLAAWYKNKLRNALGANHESPLHHLYIDQNKTKGIDLAAPEGNRKIYDQYIEAFRRGVYDYIKEDYDQVSREIVPRKYFSGGLDLTRQEFVQGAVNSRKETGRIFEIDAGFQILPEGSSDSSMLGPMGSMPAGEFRTFMEFSKAATRQGFESGSETALIATWLFYLMEVKAGFAGADDYRQAYRNFYDAYAKYLTTGQVKPKSVQSFIPVVRKPFANLKEIKEIVAIDTEWGINFFPEPQEWKGVNPYSFILSVMGDGQLHVGFYDSEGLIRELRTDEEAAKALEAVGLIGNKGIVVLVRSSFDEALRHSTVIPALAGQISLALHSHPKGAGVIPSQSHDWDDPADIESFIFQLSSIPEDFPINKDVPGFAARTWENQPNKNLGLQRTHSMDRPSLEETLQQAIQNMEALTAVQTVEQESGWPVNEMVLYLKVLLAMYQQTVGQYQQTHEDHMYVHMHAAEFAGELGHHPKFQDQARQMLQQALEGAFRILAEQSVDLEGFSSLDEMMVIMIRLVQELSIHPEFRSQAIGIIDDPKTYGLDETDLGKNFSSGIISSLKAMIKKITSAEKKELSVQQMIVSSHPMEVPSNAVITTSGAHAFLELEISSDHLIAAAYQQKQRHLVNAFRLQPEEIILARANRLLDLADGAARDDLSLAEQALREYLRILKAFPKVEFHVAVTLMDQEHIVTSQFLRPVVMEIANSIANADSRFFMLAEVALQLIKEGDIPGAMDLLKRVRTIRAYPVLEQLIDLLLVSREYPQERVGQLERMIDNLIPGERARGEEIKVELFIKLGKRFDELGMAGQANKFYQKAWAASVKVQQPAIIRLEYFVPLMREQGRRFPESGEEILEQARIIAENALQREYPNQNPEHMISLAREYALNGDYQLAEQAAWFINDHMQFPRDHYDHVYGAIMEAAALRGDYERMAKAASVMTHYVTEHLHHAAELLVDNGEYQKAMELGYQESIKRFTRKHWGEIQISIAPEILKRDGGQIEMVKGYLERAIHEGLDHSYLEDLLELLSQYPALDSDGQFILMIFNLAFEKNRSIFPHDSHRIILQKLRQIIMAKTKARGEFAAGLAEVYGRVTKALPPPVGPAAKGDNAQLPETPGGIDMNPQWLDLRTEGEAQIFFNMDPRLFENMEIQGMTPVIFKIIPLPGLAPVLGLVKREENF